jgi:hypothetical protein
MTTHTPHLTEPGKTGWSGFPNQRVWFEQMSSNDYFSNIGCSGFQNQMFPFLLASFTGISIKAFPLSPLEGAGATHEIQSS